MKKIAMARRTERRCGTEGSLDRRQFLWICSLAAAAVGLPAGAAARFAEAVAAGRKPSVVWLSLQECTGCTESLLRPDHPALAELILDLVSLDYHEVLMAAAGRDAEETLRQVMEENAGRFVLVVEGAVPIKDGGIYCRIGGRTALEMVREVARSAGLVVAIGSCASFGGVAAAEPNPTGATGLPDVLDGTPVVTIPGCPPNAYNFLGAVLQYATFGTLPEVDELGRPLFAYGRTIHEHCPRRSHFDAGRFAESFGDEGHRQGHCLYKLGCKGPQTHANCSTRHFADVVGAWPVAIGHPCVGCTERKLAFRVPLHATVDVEQPTPPAAVPPVERPAGRLSAVATGVAGAVGGALLGAGWAASRKLSAAGPEPAAEEPPPEEGSA